MRANESPPGMEPLEAMSWADWFGFDQAVRPYPHEDWSSFADAGAACVLGYGSGDRVFSGRIAPPVRWPSVEAYLASLPSPTESQAGLPPYTLNEELGQ